MTSPEIALILLWTFALWLLGWAALPLSARLLPNLPDGGLSAGRFLFVVVATLFLFWGASLKIFPLRAAPAIFLVMIAASFLVWFAASPRDLIREKRRALMVSDAVFLVAWGAFLWLRLRNPATQNFESPMDMALLAGAMKADYLPFSNPWLADSSFTNYYYFGYLMAASLSNWLQTAPHLSYNLAHPAFCAFFLSILWNLGALLTKSLRYGIGLALLVGLGGHLEPLRQISQIGKIWPLDWWSTSRVIPNTINEYPAFTLGLGDLHGHFFALSFAALWLTLLWQVFHAGGKRFWALLGVCAAALGAWLMTNTWDAPLFSLLLGLLLWRRATNLSIRVAFTGLHLSATMIGALLVAAPYFLRFQSQISGVQPEFFVPDLFSSALLWGGWVMLGCFALFLPKVVGDPKVAGDKSATFRQMVLGVGVVALLTPCFFYIRGYFGNGDLRHQDTVFKFGLQAWVLLGVGISAELFVRLQNVKTPVFKFTLWPIWALLSLAPLAVWKARSFDFSAPSLSLNAMQFLPDAQKQAVLWLQNEAPPGSIILERPKIENGTPIGDYDANVGKMATFSGVPTLLGWPQHVWFWGADYNAVMARGKQTEAIYATQNWQAAREMGATLVFFEGEAPASSEIAEIKFFAGSDGSTAAIGILK